MFGEITWHKTKEIATIITLKLHVHVSPACL